MASNCDKGLGREEEPVIHPSSAQRIGQLDGDRGRRVARAGGNAGNGDDSKRHQHRDIGLDHLGTLERVSHLASVGASSLGDQEVDGRVGGAGHRIGVEADLDPAEPGWKRDGRFARAGGSCLSRADPLVALAVDSGDPEAVIGQSRELGAVVADANDDPSSWGQGRTVLFATRIAE